MNPNDAAQLPRFQRIAVICGIVGAAACIAGFFVNRHQFFVSYLWSYLFWLGLAMGCMCLTMIHSQTSGRWGDVTRRFQEAVFGTLPVMAVLFVPLFFGVQTLFPWARPAEVAADTVLQKRAVYMNLTAWVIRAVVLLALWNFMAWRLRRWSLAQDATDDLTPTRRMRAFAAPGIIIYVFSMSVAAVDWIISVEPHWYSTMFPIIICIAQILSGLTFSIILLACCRHFEPLNRVITPHHLHQLGNLFLAFVLFWSYISFGQLLIIYSGNLPHEISWYLHRIAGSWKYLVAAIALFHFFLPFYLLLFRPLKQSFRPLVTLAAVVLTMRMVDVFWYVTPTFHPHGIQVHWLDFAAPIGIGGIWVATFLMRLKGPALMPRNDPRIVVKEVAHAR